MKTSLLRILQAFVFFCTISFVHPAFALDLGDIVTKAGGGVGDGGSATVASINEPYCITVNSAGNLFIADYNNHRVRKVRLPAISLTWPERWIGSRNQGLG